MANMNRKGQMESWMWFLIVVGVLVFILIAMFAISFIGPYMTKSGNAVGAAFDGLPQDSLNVSGDLQMTAGTMAKTSTILEYLAYIFIGLLFVTFITMSFFCRQYPILFIPYFILVIILTIVAVFMQVSYADVSSKDVILQSWSAQSILMNNLGVVIGILGFGGGAFMFFLTLRQEGVGA